MQSNLHHIVVTIHDQDLLLDYEEAQKFAAQSAVTYVFVGNGPVDKLGHLSNVVVARDLPDNIENMKFLVDFTSWYACIQNRLLQPSFVSLIQYDVSITPEFSTHSLDQIHAMPNGILGYCPAFMAKRDFIRDNMGYAPLRDACREVYGLDIKAILKTYMKIGTDPQWPATNNMCMHTETLAEFVRWFTPLAHAMGNEKPVGHAFERAIKLFAILSGRTTAYASNVLEHFQLDSHETQGLEKPVDRLRGLLVGNKNQI